VFLRASDSPEKGDARWVRWEEVGGWGEHPLRGEWEGRWGGAHRGGFGKGDNT